MMLLLKQATSTKTFLFTLLAAALALPAFSQTAPVTYPRMAGYVGLVHPIVTFSGGNTITNFSDSYTVGMPIGLNLWKSQRIGFSFEIVPFVHAENGVSKTSNLLIHPGALFSLGKGFTFVGRAAFETSGRYGLTPILNKVVKRGKNSNLFVALPVPVRFGNDRPSSVGAAFQFGIGF
jgi:hypothetical protein